MLHEDQKCEHAMPRTRPGEGKTRECSEDTLGTPNPLERRNIGQACDMVLGQQWFRCVRRHTDVGPRLERNLVGPRVHNVNDSCMRRWRREA